MHLGWFLYKKPGFSRHLEKIAQSNYRRFRETSWAGFAASGLKLEAFSWMEKMDMFRF